MYYIDKCRSVVINSVGNAENGICGERF